MLLNTSNNEALHFHGDAAAKEREQKIKWLKQAKENSICVDTLTENNPTDILSRIGTPMQSDVLERKLKVLNPSLAFQFNEFNSTKKAMYISSPKGMEYLFAYESGLMPERSIFAIEEEMVPVDEVFQPGFVIDRKEFKADGTNPYYKKQRQVWNERQRGWRTVLLKLVLCGALTPTQVETTFGAADTPEWQGHIGRARVSTPW